MPASLKWMRWQIRGQKISPINDELVIFSFLNQSHAISRPRIHVSFVIHLICLALAQPLKQLPYRRNENPENPDKNIRVSITNRSNQSLHLTRANVSRGRGRCPQRGSPRDISVSRIPASLISKTSKARSIRPPIPPNKESHTRFRIVNLYVCFLHPQESSPIHTISAALHKEALLSAPPPPHSLVRTP